MNTKLLLTAATSAALLFTASLQASNNLGDRYVEIGAYYIVPNDGYDAAAASIAYNMPLAESFDLTVDVMGQTLVEGPWDADSYGADLGLTYHTPTGNNVEGFVGASIGYVDTDLEGWSTDAFAYSAFVGLEFTPSDVLTIRTTAGWGDTTETDSSLFAQVKLGYHVSETTTVITGIEYDYNTDLEDGLFVFGLGVAFEL